MQIDVLLKELEQMFAEQKTEQAEIFLSDNLKKAMEENDTSAVLTIVNELIGLYRDTSQFENMLLYCRQSLKLMKNIGLEGTNPYAKALLNVANAYRAAGMQEESLQVYDQVKGIYEQILEKQDLDWAAYYNNLGLLYQEMNRHEEACLSFEKALSIVEAHQEERIKQAVTHGNLAASYVQCRKLKEAQAHIQAALAIFNQDEEKDFHYSAAAAAAGDLCMEQQDYVKAAAYYEDALKEQERQAGRTSFYVRVLEKLQDAYGRLGMPELLKGLSLSWEYYISYGKTMIHEKFPEYEERIAVGLAGEGSDCLGFDDRLSMDHDFGPGFCMWLTDEVYEEIGEQLQQEYEKLPKYLHGISRQTTPQGAGRTGVRRIKEFYRTLTGWEEGPETVNEWLAVEDYQLSSATNGEIFKDVEGKFTAIRSRLQEGYPEGVWEVRLAEKLARAGQYGQCSYARMMSRGQTVAASMYLGQFAKYVLEVLFYLERKYPPYDKWLFKGAEKLQLLPEIPKKLEQIFELPPDPEVWRDAEVWNGLINRRDKKAVLIEEIAALIIQKLHSQGITDGSSSYLEAHGRELLERGRQICR